MTRDEYNKKVQEMQEVWPDSAWRIVKVYHQAEVLPDSAWRIVKVYHQAEVLADAHFQIYLDRWHTLGTQRRPFQPDAEYEWDYNEEAQLMYHLAGGITSDRISR